MTRHFIDTNILLYSISTAPEETLKAGRAREILSMASGALSVQVLQEFYVQSTRAGRPDALPHAQAVALIRAWSRFDVQDVSLHVLWLAMDIRERLGFSYWDCAIVAAAKAAGCAVLYTEDMQHDQVISGIRIVNPFA